MAAGEFCAIGNRPPQRSATAGSFASNVVRWRQEELTIEPRLDVRRSGPFAAKAMPGVEQHIARAGLERSLVERDRLQVSQVDGVTCCIDVHTADARKAGESEQPPATAEVRRATPSFGDRERAARYDHPDAGAQRGRGKVVAPARACPPRA